MSNAPRVGFVGLGSQGAAMARRIIEAGFSTTLWARRQASLEPFGDTRAHIAASRDALGAASDVLCVCVVDDADVDEVLRGSDGVPGALGAMREGSIVVLHSTVHPSTCLALQADFRHLHVVDAPVSGGGDKAAAGELLVMVGGPPEVVARCTPIFAAYGDPVLHLGPLGAGQEAKLLNNAAFTAQLALAAEVFDLAASRGLDPSAVATVLAAGSGRSYATEVVAGMGFTLAPLGEVAGPLLAKDIGIVVEDAGLGDSPLLTAADAALARMGVERPLRGADPR
jgi:3-hydroxyisobutyrate dehydrogenase-like beta-hydroxyacid dehydrogenase